MGQAGKLGVAFLMMSSYIFLSCSGSDTAAQNQVDKVAQNLFNTKCALCHGINGDKQLSGAKKLTESEISKEEITAMVTNGLKQMPAFKDQLSKEEIDQVSAYAFTFREK